MSATAPTPAEVFPPRQVRDGRRPFLRVADRQPLATGRSRGPTPQQALSDYKVGDVVLGRLAVVGRSNLVVELFPGVTVPVETEAAQAACDDPTDLWVAGEVLAFIVLARGSGESGWRLAQAQDGHRATRTPPALREGGTAWITDADLMVKATGHGPALVPVTEDRRAASLADRLSRALRDADKARAQLRVLRAQNQTALEALDTLEGDHHRFAGPEEQLRFEVQLAYARRTTPAEKKDLPMRPWILGPDFLTSLESVGGIARQKVVDVVVDIVTGRACNSAGRSLHRFRAGDGGASAIRTRADGATCWRIALQKNTPAARRLHYWTTPCGQIELTDVRRHDDTRN
ncbi:hypothetical protein [Kribbella speibonae]|uniref:S1 motif domain-containing protein n=1 Tax=Kribbella speibonae TaxID=1572660 RepID=A0A4R0IXU5_9ACTN|nr:hypothetical protein [Kribbella speibonae]TCC38891.1 hypothetical protein E0H92_21230 [Kribbella speibonae]